MNQQEVETWTWIGIRIALAIVAVFNMNRIIRGFLHIFGPDGIDKKEFLGAALLILGFHMVWLEGHRSDLQHPLFSEWLYAIVFGGSMLGFGLKDILKVMSLRTGIQEQKEQFNETSGPIVVDQPVQQCQCQR